jgi:hypothetical protein
MHNMPNMQLQYAEYAQYACMNICNMQIICTMCKIICKKYAKQYIYNKMQRICKVFDEYPKYAFRTICLFYAKKKMQKICNQYVASYA